MNDGKSPKWVGLCVGVWFAVSSIAMLFKGVIYELNHPEANATALFVSPFQAALAAFCLYQFFIDFRPTPPTAAENERTVK